ncbi:hypothetical protein SCHPADRAFT_907497 [Schizopora paradoxa]|uniref:Uncharacterized protein n=1 Tax=Schizopora paradoxa TaxID=27342 RepID=A0A0H2RCZ4_9AGAM|nr:hypothetical protein SCHPADRAFT_907497 [Schizopora paradoxa]
MHHLTPPTHPKYIQHPSPLLVLVPFPLLSIYPSPSPSPCFSFQNHGLAPYPSP